MSCSYEWDENKNKVNIAKHGVDFEDAMYIFSGHTLEREDDRYEYGETRFVALGMVDNRVYVVVYTDRDDTTRRIISARKAEPHERKAYYKALASWPPPDS